MKEIRITFRDEDFAAVSRSLTDLGVIFQVEPVESASVAIRDGRIERGSTAARPTQTKKPSTKKIAKPVASPSGAAALRAIAERNRTATTGREQEAEGKAHPPSLPEDLSAKLLPYSERQGEGR